MYITQQQRRDTAANWTLNNPILFAGEIGYETDTGKAKVGDGVTHWTSLGYWQPGLQAVVTLPSPTGIAATDTSAIQTAENALNASGGGMLLFQPGTYMVTGLVKQSSVIWQGAGRYATIIQLASGANTDVIQGANFGTLTLSGSTTGGIGGWSIRDMTIDGNKSAQTGTSYGIRVYGYDFKLSDLTIRNCLTDCLYTEFGNFGSPGPDGTMEAQYNRLKLHGFGGNGWHNRGPHDSRAFDVTMWGGTSTSYGYWAEAPTAVGHTVAAGSNGVNVSTFTGSGTLNVSSTVGFPTASINAAQGSLTVATSGGTAVITYTGITGTTFTGCTTVSGTGILSTGGTVNPTGVYSGNACLLYGVHVFGLPLYDFVLDASTDLIDCVGEVVQAGGATVLFRVPFSSVIGGTYFIVPGAPVTGAGFQIGDTANQAGSLHVSTTTYGFSGIDAAHAPINFVNDGGGSNFDIINYQTSGQAIFGNPQFSTRMQVTSAGQAASVNAGNGSLQSQAKVTRFVPTVAQGWTLSKAGGSDILNANVSSNRLEHNAGLLDRWYSSNYSGTTVEVDGSTGRVAPVYLAPSGLTGATSVGRYVGGVSGAAPSSGTFNAGDWVEDITLGGFWVCLTGGTPGIWVSVSGNANLPLALAPTGAKGQTVDRNLATVYLGSMVSGTVYVSAIPLRQGIPVTNLAATVGSTAFAGVTHGWYALLDSTMTVRAVTADQTGGNWGSTFSQVSLPATASYTPPADGLYYFAFCGTFTGSGTFPALAAPVGGVSNFIPALAGTSSTGQTTPPSTGTVLAAIAPVAANRFYAYVS